MDLTKTQPSWFSHTYPIFFIGWLFGLISCSQPTNVETALEDQVLHFGLGAEPQHLDPHLATSVAAHNVLTALLEGLVSEDPETLQPRPGVAESWSISDDGLIYTLNFERKVSGAMVIQ